ncbi:MAG: glycosyltransferase family 4 protein [Geminicoccaceae bacterium]|nr:glycosyltransferase family 4 protein [Geminicoccaceae bacterium]MCS7268749.1 glycosyltransferase family 4 protein [Geminicoccaceae bacterium]MCX7631019.1 glycosyltransferase family 4 protein [Geminicoccaceae bacterium]MDW8123477.1 glycosyltransferase family 4 protein [Geminicoccaceae bacterium]MDW8340310.1 glycosyltransferase family 4 protein [Geminicoccaceae bacterium]
MAASNPSAPRRILHVFATFAAGGPQLRFARLTRLLGERFRHTVVAVDGITEAAAHCDPTRVRLLAVPRGRRGVPTLGDLFRLRRILAAERPDLLVTVNWGAIDWALANRIAPLCPHLHVEEGFGPEEADGRQLARRVWTRRLVLGGAVRLVVVSRSLEAVARSVWRVPASRLARVPNGVAVERFVGARPSEPGLRRSAEEVVAIAVGGLRPEKNPERLLRLLPVLPERPPVRLVFVGDGPQRPALEARARALGDRVVLLGARSDVPELLASADVFVLGSDTEQMPQALLEAMAAGLPVVATAVGDVPAMVAPENRPFVVPPAREHELARALARLAADRELRRRLGEANRARARSAYPESRMVEAWSSLLEGAWPPPPPGDEG